MIKFVARMICIGFLLGHGSLWAGGDLVNNGGGIAEKNLLFAFQKLDGYIGQCLSSEFCKLDNAQRNILIKIQKALGQEQKNPELLRFDSEKRNPGFFILNGEVKVAKTGSQLGSPIYINVDLLYTKNKFGYFVPIDISEAVAILIHELGHHVGPYSHAELDLLGVRVALMLQNQTYLSPLLPWTSRISASFINQGFEKSFPEILLYVEDEVTSLSSKYREIVDCSRFVAPAPILPLPIFPVLGKKPQGSFIHNIHWSKLKADGNVAVLTIKANASHLCKTGETVALGAHDFLIEIDFTLNKDQQGKWRLDKNSLDLTQRQQTWFEIW